MTLAERDEYFAQGCYIPGCDRKAVSIDHDHTVCPGKYHSCDKCRRGPACHWHNVFVISMIDELVAGKHDDVLKAMGIDLSLRSHHDC